ncbi:unnamed protein product [Effrenium voratum]|nr:unnamed protein product [Effrenium voratum]
MERAMEGYRKERKWALCAILTPCAAFVGAQVAPKRARIQRRADPDLGSIYIEPMDVEPSFAWSRIAEVQQRLRSYTDLKYNQRPAVDNPALLWWFLRDRRLDVNEATEKLVKCLRWRRAFRVEYLGPDMFVKELRSGKGYVHQHPDIAGRPVMVAIARRHSIFHRELLESSRMCTWMLETTLQKLSMLEPPRPGDSHQEMEPEQALGIFDLREFSPLQADLEVAGFLIEVLYNYYPARTGKVLLVGAPDLFKAFWDNIKPLLGRYSKLADFVTVEELRHYFHPGLEPPEFASASATARRGLGALGGLGVGVGSLGAAVLAGCWAQRGFRSTRRSSSLRRGTLIHRTPEHLEQCVQQLQQLIPRTLKWRGRPAAENRALLWWFLRDRNLDVTSAARKLLACLRWRQSFSVEKLGPELFAKEMRSRKAYLHGHTDLFGRPCLVVIAQRHNVLERRFKESCSMCAWYMERILDRLVTKEPKDGDEMGPNEQAIAVVDLNGFSPLQADLEFVCFMVDVIHNYYPRRFGKVLLVDAPDLFESFWRSVCPMLHHYQDLAEFTTASEVCRRFFAPGQAPPELQRSYRVR